MLTEYEAQKLRESMKHELEASERVVLVCAVSLVLLIVLTWFGASSEGSSALNAATPPTPGWAQPEPESKAVFDERRQRYIKAHPDSQIARDERAQLQRDAHADGGYFAYEGE